MNERIIFRSGPTSFIESIQAVSGESLDSLACRARVNARTLRSWRSGETTMPLAVALEWARLFSVELPDHDVLDLVEKRKMAGSLGGRIRQLRYGDLGTPEGRSKGGRESQKTHRKTGQSSPFVARQIESPKKNRTLAEFIGAILGDGTVTRYQVVLFSNLSDEEEYADFLLAQAAMIFGYVPTKVVSHRQNIIKVILSRKNIVDYLLSVGLTLGNKTKSQVCVPSWIVKNKEYENACLRGLIDTDGCVYIDKHRVKGREYASLCIAFTNASIPLLNFVEQALIHNGYRPTRWGRHVRLRKRADVLRYVREIGFSNPKHSRRIEVE